MTLDALVPALHRRLSQRLVSAALLLALIGSGLEIHSHPTQEAGHDADLGVQAAYDPAAAHPHQPKHFEASGEVEHPPCAACLHGLTLRGLDVPAATALRVDSESAHFQVVDSDDSHADPYLFGAGGRSPPLA